MKPEGEDKRVEYSCGCVLEVKGNQIQIQCCQINCPRYIYAVGVMNKLVGVPAISFNLN